MAGGLSLRQSWAPCSFFHLAPRGLGSSWCSFFPCQPASLRQLQDYAASTDFHPFPNQAPYLLEGLEITGPDQVWCSDITYVPMAYGFMYLVAVMDWWSRYVLAWELSNSLDSEFCIRAWTHALGTGGCPLISNTDQGSQFTSEEYLDAVE